MLNKYYYYVDSNHIHFSCYDFIRTMSENKCSYFNNSHVKNGVLLYGGSDGPKKALKGQRPR